MDFKVTLWSDSVTATVIVIVTKTLTKVIPILLFLSFNIYIYQKYNISLMRSSLWKGYRIKKLADWARI